MSDQVTGAGSSIKGERRIISVLFCDVVDSTALAEMLDPEQWAEIMNGAFQVIIPPIAHYQGAVAKLMGDAVLAFFGAPTTHEDDPERALRAALEIMERIAEYRQQVRRDWGVEFNVRIGVSTGPVVVVDVGSAVASEHTAMGDAVNVAARMEQTAEPGTIRISGETYRYIAPLFDVEPLGELDVKGRSQPVAAFRVLGLSADPGRVRGIKGISAPLIGRDDELARLTAALNEVQAGSGRIVFLTGEAGLGKSRLLEEACSVWMQNHDPDTWEQSHGSPYDTGRPYGMFQRFARDLFDIDLDDSPEVIHQKVDTSLRVAGASPDAIALCSVAFERIIAAKVLHEAKDFPADVIKKDIYDVVRPAWHEYAQRSPAVLVSDDLHWADAASIDLLIHLFDLVREDPILFLCALRPERQSPAWRAKTAAETQYAEQFVEISLRPLETEASDRLLSALLRIADLPEDLRQLILRKTDGNPYFVEEVVRSLIDQGVVYRTDDGLRWEASTIVEDISIPDTLQALLLARMDRLDRDTRSTLQLASVIGRSFYRRVLQAISNSTIVLDSHLAALERVELVHECAQVPELEYIFRHELARDAAYSSILHRRRRELHKLVGEAMETLFADRLESNAHRLAQHFAAAGDSERAMKYHLMAADAAAAVSANVEAATHLEQAVGAAVELRVPTEELTRLRVKQAEMAELAGSRA